MTFQVLNQLKDLQSKLFGYCMLLAYRYMNLCVKAEPGALLSAVINIDDNEYPLEKVAEASIGDGFSYNLFPIDNALIPNILEAFLITHPEFKQEVKDGDKENDKIIVLTVPPVDKDRRDVLLDMVDALYKDCDFRMKTDYDVAAARIGAAIITLPKESQEDSLKELKSTYDSFVQQMNQYKEIKTKEIEEAYAHYCEEHENEAEADREEAEAKGIENMFKMTLDE